MLELVVDWQALFGSHTALRGATQLTRLYASGSHRCVCVCLCLWGVLWQGLACCGSCCNMLGAMLHSSGAPGESHPLVLASLLGSGPRG